MANYLVAFSKILKREGGYVNDPVDRGGETYRGISRRFWPGWEGWPVIDRAKSKSDFPRSLNNNTTLNTWVQDFYKKNFWDKIGGDKVKSQDVANLLVDSAVNEGISPAVKRAQKLLQLPETGIINNELITKINTL